MPNMHVPSDGVRLRAFSYIFRFAGTQFFTMRLFSHRVTRFLFPDRFFFYVTGMLVSIYDIS
jgi:hypothetical protein